MSDYTPTTEQVREQYSREQPPHIGTVSEKRAEFDRWLDAVKAEAWDEGFDAGERDAFHLDTHPDHTCTPNPYRQKEQDQ